MKAFDLAATLTRGDAHNAGSRGLRVYVGYSKTGERLELASVALDVWMGSSDEERIALDRQAWDAILRRAEAQVSR